MWSFPQIGLYSGKSSSKEAKTSKFTIKSRNHHIRSLNSRFSFTVFIILQRGLHTVKINLTENCVCDTHHTCFIRLLKCRKYPWAQTKARILGRALFLNTFFHKNKLFFARSHIASPEMAPALTPGEFMRELDKFSPIGMLFPIQRCNKILAKPRYLY